MASARPPETNCPLLTKQCKSVEELSSSEVPEIRAYKLGKKRWSYNQCELKIVQEGGDQRLDVVEAVQYGNASLAEAERESGVTYQVRLTNGYRVRVHVFVVYDEAVEVAQPSSQSASKPQKLYRWPSVSRAQCKKGCQGPVLRSIQRFGRLGKRSGNVPPEARHSKDKIKEAKYMYLSIDEAGTHVNVRRFRLLMGAYDQVGHQLLGSTCSAPIRVLANNDVPSGAAFISMHLPIRADWEGWLPHNMKGAMRMLHLPSPRLTPSPALTHSPMSPADQHATRSLSSNDTSYHLHDVAGPSNFMGGFGGGGHMPQMILSHAMGSSLLHDGGAAAPALVQTGAAGLHINMSTGLWRDTATSELPPLKRSRLLHQSCPDDMLAAFSEIHDVEGAAALQAHLDQLVNLLPPVSHGLALPHALHDMHRAGSPLPLHPSSFLQPHHLDHHGHPQSPQLDPPCVGHMHSPHLSASQPLPHASPSQSDGFSSRHYHSLHDNTVKVQTGLEAGAMVDMAQGLDEEDEEEVQKVEHWTNTLIKQGSFEGTAHLKDVANWQSHIPSGPLTGWVMPQATGSEEAEEAPLAGPISLGMLGEPAPAHKSVAESLMQTFVHAYCGDTAAGLAFEAAAGLNAVDFLNDHHQEEHD
ncbi:g1943 [Coccomyxa elongata]